MSCEQTRRRISESMKKVWASESYRKRLSKAHIGNKLRPKWLGREEEYQREYRESHREQYVEYSKEWNKKHPEEHAKRQKRHREKYPERMKVYSLMHSHPDKYPLDNACIFCGATENLEHGHLDYEDEGCNYLTVCHLCNMWMERD